jgi:non-ribosomal peptide synthetase-like protein
LTSPRFYLEATAASAVVFFGAVVVGLLWICTAPRLLHLFLQPDRDYPLYGWRYALHRSINRMTNVKFFMWLLGDSSYIVPYLQVLGYDLSRVEQTGSNFGTEVAHETPFMSSVGSGTMVADGLSMINAEFSDTAFRISRASIGARSFLGNNIAYPSGAKVGDNCLLATKTMVPLDGPVREGVGLLGSPPFEIPRSVARDTRLIQRRTPERLSAKNRFNLRSMALFMGIRWLHVAVLTLLGLAAVDVYDDFGHVFLALYLTLSVLLTAAFFVLVERAFTAFRPLQPRYCSIYDPYFWWHERLWKVPDKYLTAFDGTPFKNLVWRALGVRLGKRVFDDGVFITERTLAAIGDDATLNAQVKIQCHSQEDGAFKSDHIRIGARCTLGVAAFVHYGVRLGDGAVLEPDSFLMKGTEVPPGARWGGNPAEEIDAPAQVPPAEGIDRRDAEEAVIPTPVIPPPRASGRHRNDAAGPRTLLPASRPGGRHRVGPGVEVPAVMTTETR